MRGGSSCEGPAKDTSWKGGDGNDKRRNLVEEDLAVGASGDCMKCSSSPARRSSKTSSTSSEGSLVSLGITLLVKSSSELDLDIDTLT